MDEHREQGHGQASRIASVIEHLRRLVAAEGYDLIEPGMAGVLRALDVPGISVAVIDGGEIVWARGFGRRDVARDLPVEPDTRFQAASISKPVSALAALHLVEEGKLALDADVNDYLRSWQVPAVNGWQPRITLRQLLSHSAGLTIHGFPGYRRDRPLPGVVEVLDGKHPANTLPVRVDIMPGTEFRYSGGGYTVLQQLLTDVTGEPFPELMERLVLGPAGMTNSGYLHPLPEELYGVASIAYRTEGGEVTGGWHVYPELAAAGLWTTPTDLCRLGTLLQRTLAGADDAIISPAMLEEMLTPPGEPLLGLGFFLEGEGSGARFEHSGGNEGFRCRLKLYRRGGFGAAVMTNSDLGGDLVEACLNAIAIEYGWPGYLPQKPEPVVVEPAALDVYTGRYELWPGAGVQLIVERVDDHLTLKTAGQPALPLVAEGGHQFRSDTLDLAVRFEVEAGRTTGLVLRQGDRALTASVV